MRASASVTLVTEPPRNGDYLCPDGRYRLGDVAGTVRLQKRSRGAHRRGAAAGGGGGAARGAGPRANTVQRELEQTARGSRAGARRGDREAEQRARALAEVAHMLDEVEQRRTEMKSLREAEEAASVRLAAAGREVEDAAAEEEDARHAGPTPLRHIPRWRTREPDTRARSRLHRRWPIPSRDHRDTQPSGAAAHALRSAEDAHDVENESLRHGARADASRWTRRRIEAQRLLNQARNALRAAGLEDVEARITQLQRQLKDGGGARAPDRRGQGHRAAPAGGRADRRMRQQETRRSRRRPTSPSATTPLARCSHAVADSLDLPANQVDDPVRYARQTDEGPREPHSASKTTCRAPSALPSASRRASWCAVAEYQAMVGADDRFGLRAPSKRELALAPQGWLLDVAPRLEGTSDIRLLLNFLNVTIEQLQQNLSQRVTRVVRDIILGEVVSHLVDQLTPRRRASSTGLNERLATARFFARNTRFSLKLSVRLTRHPDIPFDHVTVATALLEHGHAMPAGVQAQLTAIFAQLAGRADEGAGAADRSRRWSSSSTIAAGWTSRCCTATTSIRASARGIARSRASAAAASSACRSTCCC